jgi:hypothetical protein
METVAQSERPENYNSQLASRGTSEVGGVPDAQKLGSWRRPVPLLDRGTGIFEKSNVCHQEPSSEVKGHGDTPLRRPMRMSRGLDCNERPSEAIWGSRDVRTPA